MVVNRHKYFRWTKRTAWINVAYVVIVPAMLGTVGYMTDVSKFRAGAGGIELRPRANAGIQGKWEMRGKRRGDTISEF
jgi:hypothetical protein